MRMAYLVHILAGGLALVFGYVALYAAKGAARILPLLALPVLAVRVTMLYWLWRVRVRRTFRGIVGLSASEAVGART